MSGSSPALARSEILGASPVAQRIAAFAASPRNSSGVPWGLGAPHPRLIPRCRVGRSSASFPAKPPTGTRPFVTPFRKRNSGRPHRRWPLERAPSSLRGTLVRVIGSVLKPGAARLAFLVWLSLSSVVYRGVPRRAIIFQIGGSSLETGTGSGTRPQEERHCRREPDPAPPQPGPDAAPEITAEPDALKDADITIGTRSARPSPISR